MKLDYSGYGGTQRLPRLVGKGLAMQMVLAGEMITAQEAHRIGLVNEVTTAAELIPRAEAIAPRSSRMVRWRCSTTSAVNKGMEMTLAEGLFLEAALFGVCCSTEYRGRDFGVFGEAAAAFKCK